jgi:hypothetical protein
LVALGNIFHESAPADKPEKVFMLYSNWARAWLPNGPLGNPQQDLKNLVNQGKSIRS